MVGHHRQVGDPGAFIPIHVWPSLALSEQCGRDRERPMLPTAAAGSRRKTGMCARQVQVLFAQAPRANRHFEVRSPELTEFFQEGPEGALSISASMPKPILKGRNTRLTGPRISRSVDQSSVVMGTRG